MAMKVDLDRNSIKAMTICMIGAGGFIGSHLREKLMTGMCVMGGHRR